MMSLKEIQEPKPRDLVLILGDPNLTGLVALLNLLGLELHGIFDQLLESALHAFNPGETLDSDTRIRDEEVRVLESL